MTVVRNLINTVHPEAMNKLYIRQRKNSPTNQPDMYYKTPQQIASVS